MKWETNEKEFWCAHRGKCRMKPPSRSKKQPIPQCPPELESSSGIINLQQLTSHTCISEITAHAESCSKCSNSQDEPITHWRTVQMRTSLNTCLTPQGLWYEVSICDFIKSLQLARWNVIVGVKPCCSVGSDVYWWGIQPTSGKYGYFGSASDDKEGFHSYRGCYWTVVVGVALWKCEEGWWRRMMTGSRERRHSSRSPCH